MTWFTVRQFRAQSWITLGFLAVVAIALLVSGHNLAQLWTSSGARACHGHCDAVTRSFLDQVASSFNDTIHHFTLALMYSVPALIGIFWGAPLIARELESGTYRLAWNQSITRTRWLATKLIIIGAAALVTVGLLGWAVTTWAGHIDQANNNRITPLVYGARGIVPISYTLFAFVLGVTMGMLIRRTVPAMALTLSIYIAAVLSMPMWIRAHLIPARHITTTLDISNVQTLMMNSGGRMHVVSGGGVPGGSWLLANNTVTSTGHMFTGPANPQFCGPNTGEQACMNWIGTLHLRQHITYQPASHFWPLQFAEAGIFIAAAILLAGLCFWWTRRRLT